MKKLFPFFKKRIPLIIFLFIYLLIGVLTYKDYGVSFDEPDEYLRGKLLYIKTRGNDKVLQEDFTINKQSFNRDLLYYNHLHQAIQYQFNKTESLEVYHLLNIFFASALFIFTYELFLALYHPWVAVIGSLFLVFTPRFFADIPSNPKDIPFAVYYLVSLFAIYLLRHLNEKLRILILGVLFGLAQSSRLVGYSLYPVYLLFKLFSEKKQENQKQHIIEIGCEIILIACIGFMVHMFSLPYLGADPINHFSELIRISSKFPWGATVLLFGKEYLDTRIPWFYLPTWFFISTPVFILTLFLVSLFTKQNKIKLLLYISLFVNVGLIIAFKPVVYDGLRHVVYILGHIALLAALGFIEILNSKKRLLRTIIISFVAVNALLVAIDYVKLYPYGYVYFNELVGGLKGAYGKFETDYWSEANREAFIWLRKEVGEENLRNKSIGVCGKALTLQQYSKDLNITLNGINKNNGKDQDYAICWERWNDHEMIKGELLHTISRDGVPLSHIYKIKK